MGETLRVKTALSMVEERKESTYYVLGMRCASHTSPLAFHIEVRRVHGSEGGSVGHVTCPGPLTHPVSAHSCEMIWVRMGKDTLRNSTPEWGS